jgi:hypothetical protein
MGIANRGREGIMIDDKTRDLIAAVLTIPIGTKILEGVEDTKRIGREMEELVDRYFVLRGMIKGRYDEGA